MLTMGFPWLATVQGATNFRLFVAAASRMARGVALERRLDLVA
jgi:hypothetical protein